MQDKEKDIELRSEEVQEILGRPPQWLVQWGITVVFTVVAGLFIGSYFFQYPEIVTAHVVVTTENLPVNIVAKTTGRIDTLLVQEKQIVERDQLLAVIANPARTADIFMLSAILDSLPPVADILNLNTNWPAILRLGTVQSAYNNFFKAYEDYRYFLKADYHRKKIAVTEKQIPIQTAILAQSRRQLTLMEEQNVIAKKLFDTDSIQAVHRLIAPIEYDKAKSVLLQSYQNYESAKSSYENQKMNILQLEQAIFDLEQQQIEQLTQLCLVFTSAYDQLQAELRSWEQSYLLRSPITGTVTLTKYWQSNQNLNAGETLLTVVPSDSTQITGKIYLPVQGAGKVKVGQTVNVKFDNFPYMEHGMVKVFVKNIALVPIVQENVRYYVLEVDFPDDLQTNYGKTLPFSQEMQGTAEIVTDDLRLLDRFLRPIKALWVN
ncbi:MAG: HlyD family efflux transporter periplasmic adaptor subunit [Bacteroidales bacterium]|nr:HlyD family efflux transporter periplasmic adaptor subunit [Bacteroidales bacterium]